MIFVLLQYLHFWGILCWKCSFLKFQSATMAQWVTPLGHVIHQIVACAPFFQKNIFVLLWNLYLQGILCRKRSFFKVWTAPVAQGVAPLGHVIHQIVAYTQFFYTTVWKDIGSTIKSVLTRHFVSNTHFFKVLPRHCGPGGGHTGSYDTSNCSLHPTLP